MQKQLILVDSLTKQPIDSTGEFLTRAGDRITIERGQWSVLCFQFYDRTADENGAVILTPTDLRNRIMLLVADIDFNDEDSLMIKSFQSSIPYDTSDPESNCFNIEGDWYEKDEDGNWMTANPQLGQISVRINTDTVKFNSVLYDPATHSQVQQKYPCYINLKEKVADVSGWSTIAWVPFIASNTVRDWSSAQINPPTDYQAQQIMDSYLVNGLIFQYSPTGLVWHDTYSAGDMYFRVKLSNTQASWSNPQEMAKALNASTDIEVPFSITAIPQTKTFYTDLEPSFPKDGSQPEFEIIDSNGYNITNQDYIQRRWVDTQTYQVTFNSGNTGNYTLKFVGGITSFNAENYDFGAYLRTVGYGEVGWVYGSTIQEFTANASNPVYDSMVYTLTVQDEDIISMSAPPVSGTFFLTCELHVTQPATPVSFEWDSNIWWGDGDNHYSPDIQPPAMSTGGVTYCVVLRYDPTINKFLANLSYTKQVIA